MTSCFFRVKPQTNKSKIIAIYTSKNYVGEQTPMQMFSDEKARGIFYWYKWLDSHLLYGMISDLWHQVRSDAIIGCNYSPTPKINGGLTKSALKLRHAWVIISYIANWMELLIHAPVAHKPYYQIRLDVSKRVPT